MFKFDRITMPKGDRMIRIGLGQHKGAIFLRLDLWSIGFRASAGKSVTEKVIPELKVWYGKMPESNGKTNWTVMLYRNSFYNGFIVHRSEYEDRARYDADELRYLIGEISVKPCILDYDSELKSDYESKNFDKWYIP